MTDFVFTPRITVKPDTCCVAKRSISDWFLSIQWCRPPAKIGRGNFFHPKKHVKCRRGGNYYGKIMRTVFVATSRLSWDLSAYQPKEMGRGGQDNYSGQQIVFITGPLPSRTNNNHRFRHFENYISGFEFTYYCVIMFERHDW